MVLNVCQIVSSISYQVCLETQTEWYVQSNERTECQSKSLNEFDPFKHSGIFINDFALFEVQLCIWLGTRLLDEGLVKINWVEDVVFEFEQPVDWSTQEFRVAESVGDELVLFFRFHLDIILVTFGVEMFGDWPVGSFVFPLFDVLEVMFFMPWGVGDESVFVGEDDLLAVDIEPVESEVVELWLDWAIFINVGVDTPDAVLVGPVKVTDGLPDFSLNFKVIVKVFNNIVVLLDFDFVVVLVKFGVDVLWGVVVLVGKPGVSFVLDLGVGLDFTEVV